MLPIDRMVQVLSRAGGRKFEVARQGSGCDMGVVNIGVVPGMGMGVGNVRRCGMAIDRDLIKLMPWLVAHLFHS